MTELQRLDHYCPYTTDGFCPFPHDTLCNDCERIKEEIKKKQVYNE